MTALTLPKSIQKLLVVGPIYDQMDKLSKIYKLLPEYDWIIFNGGITCHLANLYGIFETIGMLDRMDSLLSSGKVVYNVDGSDLERASILDIIDPQQLKIGEWIRKKSNVVLADFGGSFQVVVVSGGIPTHITQREQLMDNIEISFAIHPHEIYTGGLGYVVCNHPAAYLRPIFFRYSVGIGRAPWGQLYALELDRNGVQKTILV